MSAPRLVILVAAFMLLVPLFAPADDDADAKKLTGVWKGWVVEGTGDTPKQRRMSIELTIKGTTITGLQDGTKDLGTGTFTLKTTREGKQLDATRTKDTPGYPKGTYLGIYALDGDTLKWCVANPPGTKRPTELRSKTGQFLVILTRQKEK